jgi:alkanesulfonate monooxygenase SsuD/methylene tetrahydromethanopterin reductase-like flavin-dependent oxidoreductase (luciferase family)
VLSVPNRTPGLVAWETSSLQLLSGGRFELGLGGGRPGAERDAAALGGGFGTPGERLRQVGATIRAVRESQKVDTPVLVAASRPRMLRLAAEEADIVALGLRPHVGEDELAATVATVRALAGARWGSLELHTNIAAVAPDADAVPEWVSRMVGGDPRAMAAGGGIGFLLGTPDRMADTLRRRRDAFGISYVAVNGPFMEQFAEVITRLRGDGA